MQSGPFAQNLGETLETPAGTCLDYARPLRAAGMLSKSGRGPRSGAHMTTHDAVNWTLALILDHRRGESIAENVRRFRQLLPDNRPIEKPTGFDTGLTFFSAPNAGAALDFSSTTSAAAVSPYGWTASRFCCPAIFRRE